jgi:hypothetical protein
MARVEWSVLSGDEVETLLANLMYGSEPRAVRITPTQGDFGIDVMVPVEARSAKHDIYQIKKFTGKLEPSQKHQIEKSFRRVLVALVRHNVEVRHWYLVTPQNPTLPNHQGWFASMPEKAAEALFVDAKVSLSDEEKDRIRSWMATRDRIIDWRGLSYCESLVADYPYVVDYYLHGGHDRLAESNAELAKLLGMDQRLRNLELEAGKGRSVALLRPDEVSDHVARLARVLDTDPHYRFGISIDLDPSLLGGQASSAATEVGVMSASQQTVGADYWYTVRTYARSTQSSAEREMTLDTNLHFEEGTDDYARYQDWVKYGKPFRGVASLVTLSPEGSQLSPKGTITLMSTPETIHRYRIRMRIAALSGGPLADLTLSMERTTGRDGRGWWIHGADDSGLLTLEQTIEPDGMINPFQFKLTDFSGVEVARAMPAVMFGGHLAAPNSLQMAGEYGRYPGKEPLTGQKPLVEPDTLAALQALAGIQDFSDKPVIIPDSPSPEQVQAIFDAAALLEGAIPLVHHPRNMIWKVPWDGNFPQQRAVRLRRPYILCLQNTEHFLGTHETELSAVNVTQLSDGIIEIAAAEDTVMWSIILAPSIEHAQEPVVFFNSEVL